MSLLVVELFARYKRWIPTLACPNYPTDREIILVYKDVLYRVSEPSVIRWLQYDRYDIPTSVFYDIIGDYPDSLPSIPSKPSSVIDMMVLSIMYNYIGLYDLAWEMQVSLYRNRDRLPLHWQSVGGISVNRYDAIQRKWNGDPSPYRKSQYNGMYVPYGLSSTVGERYIVGTDVNRYNYPILNDISFSIIPAEPVEQSLIDRISIEVTGRDPIVTSVLLSLNKISMLESMGEDEITRLLIALGIDVPMDDGGIHLTEAIDSILGRLST
jgi:hypothetical protein